MAARSNTTARVSRSTQSKQDEVIAGLMTDAKGKARTLRVLSKVLAETMEEIHGGKWVTNIDHEHRMIMILEHPRSYAQSV